MLLRTFICPAETEHTNKLLADTPISDICLKIPNHHQWLSKSCVFYIQFFFFFYFSQNSNKKKKTVGANPKTSPELIPPPPAPAAHSLNSYWGHVAKTATLWLVRQRRFPGADISCFDSVRNRTEPHRPAKVKRSSSRTNWKHGSPPRRPRLGPPGTVQFPETLFPPPRCSKCKARLEAKRSAVLDGDLFLFFFFDTV